MDESKWKDQTNAAYNLGWLCASEGKNIRSNPYVRGAGSQWSSFRHGWDDYWTMKEQEQLKLLPGEEEAE